MLPVDTVAPGNPAHGIISRFHLVYINMTNISIRVLLALVLLFSLAAPLQAGTPFSKLREGDIIFQVTRTSQGRAVQLATGSRWTHVGIIFKHRGRLKVFEAVQPVKVTSLRSFIRRGHRRHYVVKRLKDAEQLLTPAVLKKMRRLGRGFLGKNYDYTFQWSDRRIYCSELVWKLYQRAAGITLAKPRAAGTFQLSHPHVQRKIKERYGGRFNPAEPVVSPGQLFDSPRLTLVR